MLGDTGVGKSSLMGSYADGEFPSNMVGTAGIDHKLKSIKQNGKIIKVELWDTAGQEKYRALTRRYYEGVSGIILVFDVTDESSLLNLNQYWLPKILENSDQHIELVIVGNKADLINERVLTTQ